MAREDTAWELAADTNCLCDEQHWLNSAPMPTPLDKITDTEATTQVGRLHMQTPDPDMVCQAVRDVLAEGCYLPPNIEDYPSDKGSSVDFIDTLPMSPAR